MKRQYVKLPGKLLLVGINYDEKEKTHTAKIEEMVI